MSMASDRAYLDYLLEQLSDLSGITYRAMMGEYILYYKEKIIGGIYDNRFLVKAVEGAELHLTHAVLEPPYPGAKPMLLVETVDDREALTRLVESIYPHLPAPKPKKRRSKP